MDFAINITSSCQVRVLLVPVSPIKTSTFSRHVEIVRQFHSVRLGNVTPDLQKGASAKFSSQAFPEGQMHFQYLTRYDKEHAHLEDFQPHRRIFGVIGIMDCQEYKDRDLSKGCQKFKEMLKQYPTAIATRCFAFDPTEDQVDDTEGLIMIPNVGNMSFYLSTMICDFASEVLQQFAIIAERIERLRLLESPIRAGFIVPQTISKIPDLPASSSKAFVQLQPSMSTPQRPTMKNRVSQPPTPAPTPTPSISSSFLRRAATISPAINNRKSLTANTQNNTSYRNNSMEGSPPSPKPSMTRSSSTLSGVITPQLIENHYNGSDANNNRTKQRTPGRIKKLLADFYLLAGRLPDALTYYREAIDMAINLQDYLWLASAKEGLACTMILMTCLRKEDEQEHIVSRQRPTVEDEAIAIPIPSSMPSPSVSATFAENNDEKEAAAIRKPIDLVGQITNLYEEVIGNYTKVNTTSKIPLPKLVYAEACLKIARFLMSVYTNGGWKESLLTDLFHYLHGHQWEKKANHSKPMASRLNQQTWKKGSALSRFSIAKWMTRLWNINVDDLTMIDQIHILTHMSTVYSTIDYHRKSAWIMYETLTRILPLLIQGRATMAGMKENIPQKQKEHANLQDVGILQMLKRMCEVYGIGESNVQDGGTLRLMQEGGKLNEPDSDNEDGNGNVYATSQMYRHSFGWTTIQIDVLRQCIVIAEVIQDQGSILYYTTVLLKNMYKYISRDEQIRLASSVQRLMNINNNTQEPAAAILVDALGSKQQSIPDRNSVNHWGFNLVQTIETVPPIAHKVIYQQSVLNSNALSNQEQQRLNTSDPFIYNPFSKKKKQPEINLVKDELCEFKVVMTNPFGFDLEIDHITLSTSGIPFLPIASATVLPANDTVELRLAGTPLATGCLVIRGCIVKIIGFAEQEFLYLKATENNESNFTGSSKGSNGNNRQCFEGSNRLRYSGLRALLKASDTINVAQQQKKENEKNAELDEVPYPNHVTLNVIDDQPLLAIKSTSILHGAIMLLEGERDKITVEVQNIGHIPIDFLALSFIDSTTLDPKPINPEWPPEEQYETELYTKGTPVFTSESNGTSDSRALGQNVYLNPGESTTVVLYIYGKLGCTFGAVFLDYGYMNRDMERSTKKQDENGHQEEVTSSSMLSIGSSTLYTRQLYLPINITVRQHLELGYWDALFLRDYTMSSIREEVERLCSHKSLSSEESVEQLLQYVLQQSSNTSTVPNDKNPYCLLTFDLRNTWTAPIHVAFEVNNRDLTSDFAFGHPRHNSGEDEDAGLNQQNVVEYALTIHPFVTKRIILPLRKLYISAEERIQPIPSIDKNKQFVVSQGPKLSPEQEQARLEMFWYREHLLARIKATWKSTTGSRKGAIQIRSSLHLTRKQLNVFKKQDIELFIDMKELSPSTTHKRPIVETVGFRQFECLTSNFVDMHVKIVNKNNCPMKLILRIQPIQLSNNGAKEYDLDEKLLMQGLSQLVLPEIPANHGETTHVVPLCFLSHGQYQFLYHVEDVHTRKVYYDHSWAFVNVKDEF